MEKRIELEKRRRSPEEITELNLDNCKSTVVEGLEEFTNLEKLSLNSAGLTSLKGFPHFAKLKELELSDNRISGGLQLLQECTSLVTLNLSNNKIKDFETLEPLKSLQLESLDLYKNEVTQLDGYRDKVFELLPNLKFLDAEGKNGEEPNESDEEETNGKDEDGEGDDGEGDDGEGDDGEGDDGDGDDGESDDGEGDHGEGEEAEGDSDELADEEEDEELEDGAALGLKDLYNDDLGTQSDGDDYEEEDESDHEESDVLDDTQESDQLSQSTEQGEPNRAGRKRKHADEEDLEGDSDD